MWIEEWNNRVAAVQSHARQRLLAKTADAVDVVEQVMNNPDAQDRDRLKAAEIFLKLAGMEPPAKVEHSGTLTTQTPDTAAMAAEIAALEQREQELLSKINGNGG